MAMLPALLLIGCADAFTGHVVDGFPVGNRVDCASIGYGCDAVMNQAASALEAAFPGHASVVGSAVYEEDHSIRSGSLYIVVFALADGTHRATGAYCTVSGPGGACFAEPSYPH
jgi:hypothetical protein